jgi:hypothetical protein
MVVATLAFIIITLLVVILWRFGGTGPQRKSLNGITLMDTKDRGEAHLRRIVALTGATRVGSYYVLDVGKTRFLVQDKCVWRTPSVTDPTVKPWGTCFYPPHQEMPAAEKIATALLQLKNNPGLFDRWVGRSGAFKADGALFSRCGVN